LSAFRKLAAIDITFLGYRFVFGEYLCGVGLSMALGVLTLVKSHSVLQASLGAYLICLGINYVPMLAYTVSIGSRQNARAELGEELHRQGEAMAKFRKLSLLLLVPLFIPIVALARRRIRLAVLC
jgi:hypothetical protein